MTQLRERWEGVSLPGDYLLERWLSGDEAAGFFEASLAPDGLRAVVKLVPESAVDAAAQLALWQRTRRLRHPNLRQLLDCGRAELAGETVIYAVFEGADDTLARALAQTPLSAAEAREVLDAVRGALGYLQAQGLAHAALHPDHVAAVGDRIKLSTDALREAAADAPFAHDLLAFWHKISPGTPPRSADLPAQAVGAGIPPVADVAVPPAAPAAAPPPNPFPKWILVGAAGVVLLILGLNLRRAPEPPAQSAPAPGSPPSVTAPPVAQTPASKTTPAGKRMWRVIAFTYRTHDAAARKADQVNRRHPDLEAAVFSPNEKKGYYLVALGGRMTRESAVSLQKKARAQGLARDVYVQNYLD